MKVAEHSMFSTFLAGHQQNKARESSLKLQFQIHEIVFNAEIDSTPQILLLQPEDCATLPSVICNFINPKDS